MTRRNREPAAGATDALPSQIRREELEARAAELSRRVLGPEPYSPPRGACRHCGVSDAGPGWDGGWAVCEPCSRRVRPLDGRTLIALDLIGADPGTVTDPWVRSHLGEAIIDFSLLRTSTPHRGQAEPWAHVDRPAIRAKLDGLLDEVGRAEWTCGACGLRYIRPAPSAYLPNKGGPLCRRCAPAMDADNRKIWAVAQLAGLAGVPMWHGDDLPVVLLWHQVKAKEGHREPNLMAWGHVPPEVREACRRWAFANFPPDRFKSAAKKNHPAHVPPPAEDGVQSRRRDRAADALNPLTPAARSLG